MDLLLRNVTCTMFCCAPKPYSASTTARLSKTTGTEVLLGLFGGLAGPSAGVSRPLRKEAAEYVFSDGPAVIQ
ncbi:uncharacterized protein B0H18DRAFT_996442 [Fomitopsis serialis]|uniref:uncharacterized protein n=1 Tax=Fomitopsis serialis TaxID=139415 RepID=UPI0020084A1C|nr:uncharacterized protein B0H18DRAFT_996442 [Neoantrodia serialis]KAH9929828.1 hypothetical protein B0H18DRAFT_996442 [Neoantrodia serialis]